MALSRPRLLPAVALAGALLSAHPLLALSAQPAKFSHGAVTLVTENASLQPGRSFMLGVHFSLEPGWHIYWVNSGDSGQPPKIKWQLPEGISVGEIQWPAPRKLGSATVVDFGYEGDVTLLVPVRVASTVAPGQAVTLEADIGVLICREMCIPGKTVAKLTVPVKAQPPAVDPADADVLRAALSSLPQPAPGSWKFSATETKDAFLLTANTGEPVRQAYFFPLQPSEIENDAPQNLTSSPRGFEMRLLKASEFTGSITQLKGVIVFEGGKAYAVDARVRKTGAPSAL
jgi:DsbC/DsbD-like thiol-disulfide interchange protein